MDFEKKYIRCSYFPVKLLYNITEGWIIGILLSSKLEFPDKI